MSNIPLSKPDLVRADLDAVIDTLHGERLSQGRALLEFERKVAHVTRRPHAIGVSSGATALELALRALDIGDGDDMIYMKRFIPDFKDQVGDLTVNLLLRAFPQATASPSSLDPYTITPTTEKVDTRARGRQISLKIESTAVDTTWRFGTMRVDIQPDGLR